MRAHALLRVRRRFDNAGGSISHVERMRSDGALVLRPTQEQLPDWASRWTDRGQQAATVRLVAGAAGPIGGDQLRLDVTVGEGAMLMLGAVAATLVLPGVHGERSWSEINICVAEGATLIWTPGLQIAARECHHAAQTNIDLAPGARLYVREELSLGRHGEIPGQYRQRLRITRHGRVLYDQELAVGPHTLGWSSAAVTGGRRSLGNIIYVDPIREDEVNSRADIAPDTASMSLCEHSTLITSVAPDAIELRRRLDAAFVSLLNGVPQPATPKGGIVPEPRSTNETAR